MSNLSELLPTGGGQNAVDFVASGTLSSGVTVALKADGTVEAVAETSVSESLGAKTNFENADIGEINAGYDASNGKIVVAYYDTGNSNYGTAIVGTVSGSTISFGTPVVFESALAGAISVAHDPASGKMVIFYYDAGNAIYGTAIVGTVSGTSISFGSAVVFNSANTNHISSTYDSTNNKIIVAYKDSGNSNYATAIVGTVSGTSISFGAEVVFQSSGCNGTSCSYDPVNQKVVAFNRDSGDSNKAKAVVGTVSGTSISFGSVVAITTDRADYPASVYDPISGKVIFIFADSVNSGYGTAVLGTVSGSSISFGSEIVFSTVESRYFSIAYDSIANKIVIAYMIASNSYGSYVVGEVSGSSISFGAAQTFEANSTGNSPRVALYDATAQKVVITYKDGSASPSFIGAAKVLQVGYTATNSADFIGITAEAISDTATGPVNVYGGINEAQTGLTIGSDYYVQDDGSLSTTASSVKAGQAISATTINMMDLT